MPGTLKGSVICRKTFQGGAPKSAAASRMEFSIFSSEVNKRQHHERQEFINHSDHDRGGSIQKTERALGNMGPLQKRVEQSPRPQDHDPGVDTDYEICPKRYQDEE